MSTNMVTNYLREQGVKVYLLPALEYMRIDENGEPDSPYINTQLKTLLDAHKGYDLYITQGFICRNRKGEIDKPAPGGCLPAAGRHGTVHHGHRPQRRISGLSEFLPPLQAALRLSAGGVPQDLCPALRPQINILPILAAPSPLGEGVFCVFQLLLLLWGISHRKTGKKYHKMPVNAANFPSCPSCRRYRSTWGTWLLDSL